jgi:hypothetical protein
MSGANIARVGSCKKSSKPLSCQKTQPTCRIGCIRRPPGSSSSTSKAISPVSPATCNSSIPICRAHFPPRDQTSIVQTCELNRSRTEARCLIAFDTTATRVAFPFAERWSA